VFISRFSEPNVQWQTNNGITAADTVPLPPGAHAHYYWGFTLPGTYELEVEVSGTHATDGLQTSTQTLVITVVPEPATAGLLMLGGVGLLARRRRS
jgi:surface-anchored protein